MRLSKKLGNCAVAAIASLAFFGSSAEIAQTTSPIHIDSCDVKKVHSQYGLGDLFIKGKGYNFFNITFTNTAKVTAKHIVFQIEFEKSRYVVGDKGSFEPSQKVTHRLRDHGSDTHAFARTGTGPTECAVQAVTFSDGETWSAPKQP